MKPNNFRVPAGTPVERASAVQEELHRRAVRAAQTAARTHPIYHAPTTKADYWQLVDEWWPELMEIMECYANLSNHVEIDGKLEAKTLRVYIEELKRDRNPEIARQFNRVWMAAPDNGSIHAHTGWNTFCDLCSEDWCLYEDGPTEITVQ